MNGQRKEGKEEENKRLVERYVQRNGGRNKLKRNAEKM